MSNIVKDDLGNRMKSQYENRTRYSLPRRTYTIIRIDGKAFHTYTRGSERPFDYALMEQMDVAAQALCKEAMGCRLAYGQSDEYSFLLTDFSSPTTEAWFDGNIQKIVSVAASVFTSAFGDLRANFDARVFTIPDNIEVENYFIWRQQDATRNAIQMAAQSCFSPKQLHGVNTDALQEMLFTEKQINFNDYPTRAKRGRVAKKEVYLVEEAERSRWAIDQDPPIFTKDRDYLRSLIPRLGE